MHTLQPVQRVKGRHAVVDLVGTWESTAQATWSIDPTAASISIDSAPTPSPNSILRAEVPTSTYSSTPAAATTAKALVASSSPCSSCEATATATAPAWSDDVQHRSAQVPLVLTVVMVSTLILIALLVLGWLGLRRRRRIKQQVVGGCLHNGSNSQGDGSDVLQEKPHRAQSALTGPTLVPAASSSTRTFRPLSLTMRAEHMAQRMQRDPRRSSSTIEDCHPAFMPPTRALPPVPPPRNRLASKASSSRPSISTNSTVPELRLSRNASRTSIARLTSINTQNISTVSDQPDSPTIGSIDIHDAPGTSTSSSSTRSACDVSLQNPAR